MRESVSVEIEAPAAIVWAILTDVESWPEWTASVREVRRTDNGPFEPRSAAKIRQPSMPAMTWRVSEFEEGRAFAWETGSLGSRTRGGHTVEALGEGRSRVTLQIDSSGPFFVLFGPIMRRMTRRYLAMEAQGLKQRSEALARAPRAGEGR